LGGNPELGAEVTRLLFVDRGVEDFQRHQFPVCVQNSAASRSGAGSKKQTDKCITSNLCSFFLHCNRAKSVMTWAIGWVCVQITIREGGFSWI